MSKIKELKQNPENNISLVDIFQSFYPTGKTKYLDLIIRLVKNTKSIERYVEDISQNITIELGVPKETWDHLPLFKRFFIMRFIDNCFSYSDLKTFKKFCEYNERGLINQNDLSKYKSFDEIMVANGIAELRVHEKDLEKQVSFIYDDSNEWVVLRPLTFYSSKKYGSSTRWCTTSENNPEYFLRYARRGILIYTINKITGLKVACFKSLDDEPEFSFWNQQDTRIDSLESDLPNHILDIIKNEIKNNPVTNISLLSEEDRKKEESLLRLHEIKAISEVPVPVNEMTEVSEERMFENINDEVMEETVRLIRNHYIDSRMETEPSEQEQRGYPEESENCVA